MNDKEYDEYVCKIIQVVAGLNMNIGIGMLESAKFVIYEINRN